MNEGTNNDFEESHFLALGHIPSGSMSAGIHLFVWQAFSRAFSHSVAYSCLSAPLYIPPCL